VRRLPWDVLLALLAGLAAGLVYAWLISPLRVTDADPTTLHPDFKQEYRSAIAAAYAATGNLARAKTRLALLNDPNPVEALNAQAQRMMADSESLAQADEVAALALALQNGSEAQPPSNVPTEVVQEVQASFTETLPPAPADIPFAFTETPVSIETQDQPILASTTPRPTQTLPPTLGAPYKLTGQDSVCDTNLPDGLLQVLITNSNRRQVAGVGINITWDGGEEQFFTGLKPELGNGYADYIMTPSISYTVQLAMGSDVATGLITPTCQSPTGESFFGGIKLTFQQP
jgi:hypothetical protein